MRQCIVWAIAGWFTLGLVFVLLSACNTVEGAGEDIESAGEGIQGASEGARD